MVEHVRDLVHPAPLVACAGEDLVERLPEAQSTIPDGQFRGNGQATGLEVDQQLAPALRALPHPDMEAEQFLLPFRRRPDDHEDAFGLRFHPGLEVDAVRPDVDVTARREIAALPAVVLLLPTCRQPRDDARRQVRRVLAEKGRQRLLEVAGGDAAQVKHRQKGIEALRAPRPSRQDVRGEPDLRLGRHVGRAVAHLLPLHRDRPDPGLDRPLRPGAVPDDALAPVRQQLIAEKRHEARGLGLQRRHQHPARALAGDLGQRVDDRTRLVKGDDRGIVVQGVSLLREVLAGFDTRHDTPPSQAPSPIFSHSSAV